MLQFKTYKIVYRRYAGLFFSVGIDVSDNELTALEAIHLFVEILDHYFSNVCELDLVFNFHKVPEGCVLCVLGAVCAGGSLVAAGRRESVWLRHRTKHKFAAGVHPLRAIIVCVVRRRRLCVQVYLILDEFILGGEFEETSKKVRWQWGTAPPGVVLPASASVQACARQVSS